MSDNPFLIKELAEARYERAVLERAEKVTQALVLARACKAQNIEAEAEKLSASANIDLDMARKMLLSATKVAASKAGVEAAAARKAAKEQAAELASARRVACFMVKPKEAPPAPFVLPKKPPPQTRGDD